ncbi:hypothetical protein M9H77_13243 [Catharanthus roseus]|uniref:Uncharacterized protein n=1 Tax=Catharanthus roseus TaxID=4058 RepID=A0ACC0BJY8_CATRO|nr:hypothetical protein M9H77_13243 [Catharanthus roseus]
MCDLQLKKPQLSPIWNRLLFVVSLIGSKGCLGGSGWPPKPSVGDSRMNRPPSLFIAVFASIPVHEVRELAVRKERERYRGRRLPEPVIPSRLRPLSGGFNTQSSFSLTSAPRRGIAAARRLFSSLVTFRFQLLSHLFDFLPAVSWRRVPAPFNSNSHQQNGTLAKKYVEIYEKQNHYCLQNLFIGHSFENCTSDALQIDFPDPFTFSAASPTTFAADFADSWTASMVVLKLFPAAFVIVSPAFLCP